MLESPDIIGHDSQVNGDGPSTTPVKDTSNVVKDKLKGLLAVDIKSYANVKILACNNQIKELQTVLRDRYIWGPINHQVSLSQLH